MPDAKRLLPSAAMLCLAAVCAVADPPLSDIDLELRPEQGTACLGYTLRVGLYAVSDNDPNSIKTISNLEAIISWDPQYVQLLGNVDPGTPAWYFSGFYMPDYYNLNESNPPQDGDGIYSAFGQPDSLPDATPEGLLITTFEFDTLAESTGTTIDILETAGSPPGRTRVFSGAGPNLEVTGDLVGCTVGIVHVTCPGDLNGDLAINIQDLAELLGNYGTTTGASPQEGDLDCDGDIDLSDLAALLAVYGTSCG